MKNIFSLRMSIFNKSWNNGEILKGQSQFFKKILRQMKLHRWISVVYLVSIAHKVMEKFIEDLINKELRV